MVSPQRCYDDQRIPRPTVDHMDSSNLRSEGELLPVWVSFGRGDVLGLQRGRPMIRKAEPRRKRAGICAWMYFASQDRIAAMCSKIPVNFSHEEIDKPPMNVRIP